MAEEMGSVEAVRGVLLEDHPMAQIEIHKGSSYRDKSTIIVVPTRGMVSWRVVSAWRAMVAPMNQKLAGPLFAVGMEVGHAYNQLISMILADPGLSQFKYVLTLEDDNLPLPDAHLRLLESIETSGLDAVSGIYFTKGAIREPMAYGDPLLYSMTGTLDFRPLDIKTAYQKGHLIEVNGIAMGCALWKMSLFRDIPAPWFVTLNDVVHVGGAQIPMASTQDLYFCKNARMMGKRFGVDMRVKVGHLDIQSGIVY